MINIFSISGSKQQKQTSGGSYHCVMVVVLLLIVMLCTLAVVFILQLPAEQATDNDRYTESYNDQFKNNLSGVT